MSEDEPIIGKVGNGHKEGRYSTMRRLQSAQAKFTAWRNETEPIKRLQEVLRVQKNLQAQAHLQGHRPDPQLCYDGEPDGHWQTSEPLNPLLHPDQYQGGETEEIVLFFREAKTQKDCD